MIISSVVVYCFVFEQMIMLVDNACHRYCCIVKIGFELYCFFFCFFFPKPVDVVFVGSSLFAEIYLHGLLSCL
jgi:hypothetical protein